MRRSTGIALIVSLVVMAEAVAAERPRIEFELVTEGRLSPTATQTWYQTLTDLGVSGLQIRAVKPGDEVKIDRIGNERGPSYKVTGRISARGMLVLPGGQFTTTDGAKIKRWINELANNGIEGVAERKSAFGLTRKQVETVMEDLSLPVEFSTKGMMATDAAREIVASLDLKVLVEADAKRSLAADDPLRDELEGLSAGTALAALLRPAGAVLIPEKPDGGELRYRIASGKTAEEAWPVGWPTDKQPAKAIPKLFEFLNAEIDGVSAAEAIEAIQGRLNAPVLFDHNNIARHRIDLTLEVSVPAKRTYYSKVLEQVLFNVGLKYDLRVDENDKPFLWITTLKK